MKKGVFVVLGLFFFVLGAIGAILPMLPTTPFLLVAAACFARGSERFNLWFTGTRLYKRHLDSFVTQRSMMLKTKILLCGIATVMLGIAFFMMSNLPGRIVILCVILFKYYYFIFRIRTIKPESDSSPLPTSPNNG